jgi:hypothetical protein
MPRWPAWSLLPRDARDTLFLLAVIGWTVLPHVSHLPPWCSALTFAVLAWRARLAVVGGALPGRWVLVAVLAVAAGLTFWSFSTLMGKQPGVTLVVVLMALKTLELRARRDAFVVFFLGFFLVLTHFLYSQSLPVAAAMLVSVWGLLTALVLAHMPVGQPSLRQASGLAARTAVLGAPIMVLLFVLFPRVGPLWGVPQDNLGSTGLSNSMRMGSVAEAALDERVAMRLRFEGEAPPPQSLYFRGPVLGLFDGETWLPMPPGRAAPLRERSDVRPLSPELRYEVTLEPTRLAVVPLLEAAAKPPQIEGLRLFTRDDLQWVAPRPLVERVRFEATAHAQFTYGPTRESASLRNYVDLPAGYNPRTLQWAADLRRRPEFAQADARTLVQGVLRHIRSGGYTYTLAPGGYLGTDSIDQFWLDRKEGFCEHFAAAFVVVLRALDVPARVVTGYQGAEPLPVDGYTIVRQSSAHAWAEYWQPGVGWERADPTAAVAPERIFSSRNLVAAPGLVAGALGNVSPALLAQLRNAWESVNNRWNQWVLNYSRGDQFNLLKNLGFGSPSWEDLALLLITALSALALAGAVWAWWDRHRIDPWVRQAERLRQALRSAGVPAAAHEPPGLLAVRAVQTLGPGGEPLATLLRRLEAQRYSRTPAARPDPLLTREFVAAARAVRAAAGSAAR